jgi:predicted HTH transcriptional regulator
MSERAETLFKRLQSLKAIAALIGQSEDGDFDCKEWWPKKMDSTIAKAVCGFANATGGIIIVGMKAKGTGSGTPDVVESESPVTDVGEASSAILDIILNRESRV